MISKQLLNYLYLIELHFPKLVKVVVTVNNHIRLFYRKQNRATKKFAEVINGAKITNSDYEELVTAPGKNTFIFLGPPY